MTERIIRYKSLPLDKCPRGFQYEKGVWYREENFRGLCNKGFHCSINVIDAMSYVNPGWIAEVEVRGKSDISDDKEAWSEIRILRWKEVTKKDLLALAIFSAESCISNFTKIFPEDSRPGDAIKAAKAVFKGDSEAAWLVAWAAAEEAAEEAAREAQVADSIATARSAVWAARSAVEVAWAAAEAAWAAAEAAWAAEAGVAQAAAETAKAATRSATWAARAAWAAAEEAESVAEVADPVAQTTAERESENKIHDFFLGRLGLMPDSYSDAK